jgi:tetratricopeptide (TPR) repeat protein
VILATLGSNLKEFPPLGSLHKTGLETSQVAAWDKAFDEGIKQERDGNIHDALRHYDQALALDASHAELAFRAAQCHFALGSTSQAMSLFVNARDLDAMQFRSDTSINEAVRQVASRYSSEQLSLCDLDQALRQGDTNRQFSIPGLDYFHDHVHFRFDGDYYSARSFFPLVTNQLSHRLPQLAIRATPVLTREECARRLGLTLWDEIQLLAPAVELTRKPPFLDQADHVQRQTSAEQWLLQEQKRLKTIPASQYLQTYEYAIRLAPDDWMLKHNYAVLLNAMDEKKAAAKQMEQVVRTLPHAEAFHVAFGYLLADAGRLKEAEEQFATALKLRPESSAAQAATAWLASQRSLPRQKPNAN